MALFLLLPGVSAAQPSPVALAYPVENITVDGDLSDWPRELPTYPVARMAGVPLEDPDDFEGSFRVGYDADSSALYVAAEMIDDVYLEGNPYPGRNDGCYIWLDGVSHSRIRMPIGFWQAGGEKATVAHFWRPVELKYGEIAMQRSGNRTTFEFRIDFPEFTDAPFALTPGETVRISVGMLDADPRPNSPSEPPHPNERKMTMSRWLDGDLMLAPEFGGDVLMMAEEGQTGVVEGTVALASGRKARSYKPIRIRNLGTKQTTLNFRTDRQGRFRVELPVGRYSVEVALRGATEDSRQIATVKSGEESRVSLRAPKPQGLRIPAGAGTIRKAGHPVHYGPWRSFGPDEGFPAGTVSAIHQGKEGHLWFGTTEGLCEFDGARFRVFSTEDGLPSNQVTAIVEDNEGNLWLGIQDAGIVRFDGESFVQFNREDGLTPTSKPSLAMTADGTLLVGMAAPYVGATGAGLAYLAPQGEEIVRLFAHDGLGLDWLNEVVGGGDGRVWFSVAMSYSLHEMVNDTARQHPLPLPREQEPTQDDLSIRALAPGNRGNHVWVGLRRSDGVVCRFDGESWERFSEGLDRMPTALLEDSTGTLQVGTRRGLYELRGERFHKIPMSEQVVERPVTALFEDREGRLWVGTDGGGVHCLEKNIRVFTEEDGLSNRGVNALAWHQGGLLVGSGGGLDRWDGESFHADRSVGSEPVTSILADQSGGLMVGLNRIEYTSNKGVLWFDQEGRRKVAEQVGQAMRLNYGTTTSIVQDRHGVFWIGCRSGVIRFDGESVTTLTALDGLASGDQINCLTLDEKDRLWIGAREGLAAYDRNSIRNFTVEDGLPGKNVQASLLDSKGNLWFGCEAGLVRYRNDEFVETFTTESGLPSVFITAIAEGPDGRLWIGTWNRGVAIFDGNVFQSLPRDTGLAVDHVNDIVHDTEGNVWIASDRGLTRYRPRTTPPEIRVTGVTADRFHEPAATVELIGKHPITAFEFEGVSLKTHPDDMAYLCQLIGYDATRRPVYEGRLEYADLPYGEYEFQVEAVDQDHLYSGIASMTLIVRRDRVQLALIGGLGFAGAGLLIVSGIAVRHRRQRNQALVDRAKSMQEAKDAAEREKDAAESANRAKSAFLANMSHEIRTPMNAILGYTQLMSRSETLSETDQRSIETIQKSGDHLLAMINDILDLSKIEAGRLELTEAEFDLKELIGGLEVMFRQRCEKKGLELKVEFENAECEARNLELGSTRDARAPIGVRGDVGKLRQVLINLLGNAAKFTERGSVTLRVGRRRREEAQTERSVSGDLKSEVSDQTSEHDQRLLTSSPTLFDFEVIDTGPGVANEEQAEILKPFVQGRKPKHQGETGLGLAISQRLIQLMGGELKIDSEMGKGSRFWFEVPMKEAAGEGRGTTGGAVPTGGPWNKRRVRRMLPGCQVAALVVDDVLENRDVLSRMLREIGCKAEVAESGEQALEVLGDRRFDIVFLDIRMPGMDGMETLKRMKSEGSHQKSEVSDQRAEDRSQLTEGAISNSQEATNSATRERACPKVVAVSASVLAHQRERFLEAGFDAFIGKPFRFEEICACLSKLLGIEFESETVESAAGEDRSATLDSIRIPEAMQQRLRAAAEDGSATELNRCFSEMRRGGDDERRLAGILQPLAREFDMNGILEVLEALQSRLPSLK